MKPITITRADTVTLRYRITEDGSPMDITGMTFKLAVKEAPEDTAFRIGPLDGSIDDAEAGMFSITLEHTHTDQAPFAGRAEIAMYDASGAKTTLTPASGLEFRLVEDIIS